MIVFGFFLYLCNLIGLSITYLINSLTNEQRT